MLKDIRKITKHILNQFEPDNRALSNPIACYDVYRKLALVINNANLVAEHYLALDFNEPYLTNSSWGKPSDKWRKFFNEDLEKLNEAIKEYLLELMYLAPEDRVSSFDSFMDRKYYLKYFYAFVRDEYNVGYVNPCGFSLISTTLKTNNEDNETLHIKEYKRLDLESYESRVALQEKIRAEKKLLEVELQRLKEYIVKNYTLEMLL
jgi:alpha-L-fucosidase